MDCTIANVGEKLIVGQIDTSFLTLTTKLLPGTAVLNGPVIIGATGGLGINRATCMIGPPLTPGLPASLEVIGITNILGNLNVPAVSNITGAVTVTAAVVGNGALTWNGVKLFSGAKSNQGAESDKGAKAQVGAKARTGASSDTGPRHISGPTTGTTQTANDTHLGLLDGIAGKGFDLPHPTKKKHRLRYICLEGPEVGAYIRGKLENSDVIELPEYWRKLVYTESITVNLTPYGHYQELFIDRIEWGTKIKIKNNAGSAIKCYYTVFAERVTNDKLQPEYKGLTPADYPGDNSEYALGGWDYATHKGEFKSSGL